MDIKNMDNEELLAEYGRALKDLHTSGNPDAADRAIDADAEILSRMQGWVSVDTALPENEDLVLVACSKMETAMTAYYQEEGFYAVRDIQGDFPHKMPGEVTHWQYLPQPPKDVK